MSLTLIVPAVEDRPEPTPVREPSSTLDVSDLSILREPFESPRRSSQALRPSARNPRRTAARPAAMVRELGGRTEAALRREVDRFFATRSGLSHADQAGRSRGPCRGSATNSSTTRAAPSARPRPSKTPPMPTPCSSWSATSSASPTRTTPTAPS